MSSKLIRNLKTLFHEFIYYKEDDETNFYNWLNEKVSYNNGTYVNNSIKNQEINVSLNTTSSSNFDGDLKIIVDPGVFGQNVKIVRPGPHLSNETIFLTTDSNGYCVVNNFHLNNLSTTTITAEEITLNGVIYTGASTTNISRK